MKRAWKAWFIIASSLICNAHGASSTIVNASDTICAASGTRIGFTNGIQTDSFEALKAVSALKKVAASKSLRPKDVKNFYHTKGRPGQENGFTSFKLDLLEVYWQKAQEMVHNDAALEAQAMAVFHQAMRAPIASTNPFVGLANILMRASSDETAVIYQQQTAENVATETRHDVALMQQFTSTGDTLMMVAHSQGTLWANAALQSLQQQYPDLAKRVHLTSAGMAASSVWQTPGSSFHNVYVTNTLDNVINTLRDVANAKGFLPPPTGNHTHSLRTVNNSAANFFEGHSFIDIYLDAGSDTGDAVINNIVAGFQAVAAENPPSPILVRSDVTFGLPTRAIAELANGTWQPDYTPQKFADVNGNTVLSAQMTRADPAHMRVTMTTYCSAMPSGGADVAAQTAFAWLVLPQDAGPPTALFGNIFFNGNAYPVSRVRSAPVAELGTYDWLFAQVQYQRTNGITQATLNLF